MITYRVVVVTANDHVRRSEAETFLSLAQARRFYEMMGHALGLKERHIIRIEERAIQGELR